MVANGPRPRNNPPNFNARRFSNSATTNLLRGLIYWRTCSSLFGSTPSPKSKIESRTAPATAFCPFVFIELFFCYLRFAALPFPADDGLCAFANVGDPKRVQLCKTSFHLAPVAGF